MEKIVDEYLCLLCEMSGARSASLRIIFDEGGDRVVLLDRIFVDEREAVSDASEWNLQIPFVVPAGLSAEGPSLPEKHVQQAGTDIYWYRLQYLPGVMGRRDVWEISSRFDGGEWQFRGKIEGFLVEMSITLRERQVGFIQRRLNTAGAFLRFLQPLMSCFEISHAVRPQDVVGSGSFAPPLIGLSLCISELKRQISSVADCDIPVLIEGESGTGKEIVARNLHNLSERCDKPLVIINCMELPATLLQSELYGHMKGSFTGASKDRAGLIESARGGTFFLDEIGEMPLAQQATILRVLQEKEVRRIGDSVRRNVDVRFIFATNKDLSSLVKKGKFRQDLYFRVNGVRLFISPLRRRREDILPLAKYFLGRGRMSAVRNIGISAEAVQGLLSYDWPGNVRELKHEMERITALNRDVKKITPDLLSPRIREAKTKTISSFDESGETLPAAVRRLERRMIENALEHFEGNRTRAAVALGITRQGLLKKLKRYGIERKGDREHIPDN